MFFLFPFIYLLHAFFKDGFLLCLCHLCGRHESGEQTDSYHRTVDAQTIIIPNGMLSTGMLKNYSTEPYRRVDLEGQCAYGTDYEEVKSAIMEIINQEPKIIKEPVADSPVVAPPFLGLTKLGESGVVINARLWCKGADYWAVFFFMNETVYQQLRKRGFMFPFNRMDVNIVNKA